MVGELDEEPQALAPTLAPSNPPTTSQRLSLGIKWAFLYLVDIGPQPSFSISMEALVVGAVPPIDVAKPTPAVVV